VKLGLLGALSMLHDTIGYAGVFASMAALTAAATLPVWIVREPPLRRAAAREHVASGMATARSSPSAARALRCRRRDSVSFRHVHLPRPPG
jgi:hypothetical protein